MPQPLVLLAASTDDGSNRLGAACITPVGSGQKLWVELILITPSFSAFKIPGTRRMRMPWLSSAYSNPKSAISRSMA